jgi:hypothetical protein
VIVMVAPSNDGDDGAAGWIPKPDREFTAEQEQLHRLRVIEFQAASPTRGDRARSKRRY